LGLNSKFLLNFEQIWILKVRNSIY
jgi:hypothetical protein